PEQPCDLPEAKRGLVHRSSISKGTCSPAGPTRKKGVGSDSGGASAGRSGRMADARRLPYRTSLRGTSPVAQKTQGERPTAIFCGGGAVQRAITSVLATSLCPRRP